MQYMIHAMPKRLWYVEQYLIPSMIEQGIDNKDILVYNDDKQEGNLKACMNAYLQLDDTGTTWHLQDDVVISNRFAEVTKRNTKGIVCGFKSVYDGEKPGGSVNVNDMWFSFLCIHIPNSTAKKCATWVLRYIIGNPIYKEWWENGKNDDMLFRKFIEQYYKDIMVLNLNPNIVDHIDYLIGGTVNSSKRGKQIRSKLWEDNKAVQELEKKLQERRLKCGSQQKTDGILIPIG